jgi:hypothetical protein
MLHLIPTQFLKLFLIYNAGKFVFEYKFTQ